MTTLSNVIVTIWFVTIGLLAVVVIIAFLLNNRVKYLFARFGSSVLPNVMDLLSINTPSNNFQVQKYILKKAYKNELQPELRSIGRIVYVTSIVGLVLTALAFIVTGLAIWASVTTSH